MDETERYIKSLLLQQNIESCLKWEQLFRSFVADETNRNKVKLIQELQREMTKNWQLIARKEEIKSLPIVFPNGIVGKSYEALFDFAALGLTDIAKYQLSGFENSGLTFNTNNRIISGIPDQSGDIRLNFEYRLITEPEDAKFNTKQISIIINPDPKSLWRNIPSDQTVRFAKPDEESVQAQLADKTLVVASKRGRSHANNGSYREDDFAFADLENGWTIIAVSDGAGSAGLSRKGSQLACQTVIDYFKEKQIDNKAEFENIQSVADLEKIRPYLGEAARQAHTAIARFSTEQNESIEAFHATLAFALVKQLADTCLIISFGVGDCPIVLISDDFNQIRLMNKLDVGSFGGGTRFITMPEILEAADFESRVTIAQTNTMKALVLMTDGIYDPKFEVEANLENPEKWKNFFTDLNGNNPEEIRVDLFQNPENSEVALLEWMNFWSPGNHDDRTLAILF
ncbi:PP2C family serine/threonine-protein phosphatase [Flavobacterium cerinum]|uniref:Protein phosphatase 2C domain-containing protein n=1 Tax=Flavobacterium cerinum TaxID=2502784 RepID=A0ABY5IPE2_9FLAO|nr:PP2C family serine/threonine-protein phosphatase [Flavobacterium cerinum]UUC44697.1 protein phosphatase 2C domain-containing protein [Flavobacterium cerinum]